MTGLQLRFVQDAPCCCIYLFVCLVQLQASVVIMNKIGTLEKRKQTAVL